MPPWHRSTSARCSATVKPRPSPVPWSSTSYDSGVCVDALNGAPGVYSARYGGPELDDAARYRLLLGTMVSILLAMPLNWARCLLVSSIQPFPFKYSRNFTSKTARAFPLCDTAAFSSGVSCA